MTRKTVVVLVGVAAVAIGATALAYATDERSPQALGRPQSHEDVLPANTGFLRSLDPGSARKVASFRLASGQERGVFLARTRDGKQVCVWDTDLVTGDQGGGCNASSAFFGEHSLAVSIGYDGGPARSTIRDVRIIGLATSTVASVAVELSNGEERSVKLTRDQGIAWPMPNGDVKRGLEPVAVIARDASGQVLERQQTGF